MSKRERAAAVAQYNFELSALEGRWDDANEQVHQVYLESAKAGLTATDLLLFSDETINRVTNTLFAHTISDKSGANSAEVYEQSHSAAIAVVATLKAIARE